MAAGRATKIITGVGATAGSAWFAITQLTTAFTLPEDAGKVWTAIVSAPEYLPAGLVAVNFAVLVWAIWHDRRAAFVSVPMPAESQVVVHRVEHDPIGDLFRRQANRPYVPSPRQRFNAAVLALQHVTNAREMWWATVHQRSGPSPLGTRLLDAIDAIRQCFPPGAAGSWEEDQISRLHSAAANYGRTLGFSTSETDRLKAARERFELELAATIARFEQPRDATTKGEQDG